MDPAVGFFHLQTKDTYSEQITEEEIRWVEELTKGGRVPVPGKRYPHAGTIRFASKEETEEFPRVLRERRTWRKFGREAVAKDVLGRLLHLSFAVQGWERIPTGGRYAMKTAPSGGGLHPAPFGKRGIPGEIPGNGSQLGQRGRDQVALD